MRKTKIVSKNWWMNQFYQESSKQYTNELNRFAKITNTFKELVSTCKY